jgi:hypothetical protein
MLATFQKKNPLLEPPIASLPVPFLHPSPAQGQFGDSIRQTCGPAVVANNTPLAYIGGAFSLSHQPHSITSLTGC